MTYKLFIDDERFPPNDGSTWIIVRTLAETVVHVSVFGMPSFISFDHDLGKDQPTGYDIARKLVNMDLDGVIQFPDDFSFYVHSQNPVGKINIESVISSYLKFKKENGL